ncbi:YihY family inner membrane protein [Oligoflexaceae bacterium]|nr:YihY family inner membrane protein [Oligoflexaceae bacterium]
MKRYLDWTLFGLRTLVDDMARCDLFKQASAMAYVMLLSIVPSLAAIFSLISLFSPLLGEEGSIVGRIKGLILDNLASGSGMQAVEYMEGLIQNLNIAQIGLTGLIGILISLILLLKQIEGALNRIWLVKKERNILTRFIYFWTFVTLGTFIAGLAFGTLTGFNLKQYIPFDGHEVVVDKTLIQFLTPKLAVFAFFTMLYKVVPNTLVTIKHAMIGALPASLLFLVASNSYGSFTAKFTNYQAVYGALAAIPLFLLWLYVLWLIIFFGAVIAWRAGQGFSFKSEVKEEIKLTPIEKLRNHQLQAIVPLVTISYIYQQFLHSDGDGANGQTIANETKFPTAWIIEALDVLETKKFIVRRGQEIVEGAADDTMQSEYFPAVHPGKLKLSQLADSLKDAAREWVSEWQLDQSPEMVELVAKFANFDKNEYGQTNFDAFILKLVTS